MKTLVLFAMIVASVAAKGSGPYLPSGWRPEGPAFFLPSENVKPKDNPVKEIVFQESEASGSDSFQEYGPPKAQEVFQELSKQALPDALIEQTFATIEQKLENNEIEEALVTEDEAIIEEPTTKSAQQSFVPVTESLALDEVTSFVSEPIDVTENTEILSEVEVTTEPVEVTEILPVEVTTQFSYETGTAVTETTQSAVPQEFTIIATEQVNEEEKKKIEAVQQENDNANSDIVSTIEERLKKEEFQTVNEEVQKIEAEVKRIETEAQRKENEARNFETEVKKVEQVVQNIPELLINIDSENKKQQKENIQEITAAKAETFGSLEQGPEGFLEYGPPGFKEYGPPKEDLLSATSEEISPELQSIEINETRKRRFSPKFRAARKTNRN